MVDSDDVLDTEFESEEEAEGGSAAVQKLREKLKKAVEEKQEYLEGWQRSRADFANFKREEASLHSDREERIKAEFAEAIIPAIDNFWFAMQSSWFEQAPTEWQQGIRKIMDELLKSLASAGVQSFGTLFPGETLSHNKYEVLQEVPTNEKALDGAIDRIYRQGYYIGDRVIRPAQVSVYTYKTQ